MRGEKILCKKKLRNLLMKVRVEAIAALSMAANVLLLLGLPNRGGGGGGRDDVIAAQQRFYTLTCATDLRASRLLAQGTLVSPSPLSRGLRVGPWPAALADVLVVVPAPSHAAAQRVWSAWGDLLAPTASLEVVLLSSSSSGGGSGGDIGGGGSPKVRLEEYGGSAAGKGLPASGSSKKVREVVWPGAETGAGTGLSAKLRRHFAWAAAQARAGDAHYASRKWIVKADTDTFFLPRHLLALLSWHDPSTPVYLGKNATSAAAATVCGSSFAAGVLYAMSLPALDRLATQFAAEVPEVPWPNADAMVGCHLAAAGVALSSTGSAIWDKRLWNRQFEAGPDDARAPLVAVHSTDEATMLDFRALANIEFEFGVPASSVGNLAPPPPERKQESAHPQF